MRSALPSVHPGLVVGDESALRDGEVYALVVSAMDAVPADAPAGAVLCRMIDKPSCPTPLWDFAQRTVAAAAKVATALHRGGRVLVHCEMGFNRSVAVCVAVAMELNPGRPVSDIVAGIIRDRETLTHHGGRAHPGSEWPTLTNRQFRNHLYALRAFAPLFVSRDCGHVCTTNQRHCCRCAGSTPLCPLCDTYFAERCDHADCARYTTVCCACSNNFKCDVCAAR